MDSEVVWHKPIHDPPNPTSDNASGTPPALPLAPPSDDGHISRSAQHLIQQLTQPHRCPHEHHALQLQNHLYRIRNHRHTSSECNSVGDLLQILDPTLPHNDYIPDVLSRNDIKIANRYTYLKSASAEPSMLSDELMQDHRFHKLFEGRENHSTKPQNVCLHLGTSSKLGRPPTRAFDIDSACGFTASLGVFPNGLDWVIKPHRVRNVTSNIHGVHLSVPTQRPDGHVNQLSVPIHKVPHIYLGSGVGLLKIEIFVFFPQITNHVTNFLSDEQEALWYNEVRIEVVVIYV
ncbi:hypothetical protein B0J14DRAFT_164925 [Halenospora varia]|nr:hypothetical protein B0J14DRAFT_164925 [Halenospora varia]